MRTAFFNKFGMREDVPAVTRIASALSLILGRGYGAPHSGGIGLGRVIIGVLLRHVLIQMRRSAFSKSLQTLPFLDG
jgi:hypothetical protein